MTHAAPDAELRKQRQVIFWRLLGAAFGATDQARNIEKMTGEIVESLGMPKLILDPNLAVDTLLQRYPELKPDFDALQAVIPSEDGGEKPAPPEKDTFETEDARRWLAYSKLLLNVFGPNTMTPTVTAQQFNQWKQDVERFEACMGFAPGQLLGKSGGGSASGRYGPGVSGGGRLVSEEQLQAGLKTMEGDIVKRMELREILKDDRMAAQLTPSMTLVEQLLLDKSNLSGNALKNAKLFIRRFVDQLAEVLKVQVAKAVKGKVDRSVPPKRVFRNLDLKRTLWKNLVNYNPQDGRLYVDQLYYKQTATKTLPSRLIVVVDQSGSMVDAMVQTAILASIFAGLPKVDVHLIAFDTNVLDLTAWVHDPFEVLMRTNLGGGNDGPKAMVEALKKVSDARQTTMVWISDFYEFDNDRPLFEQIKAVKESGVKFIPVGALQSTGYFSVNEWFRVRLKEIGLPILSGSIKKLIDELKHLL
jgi:hypothetical protein